MELVVPLSPVGGLRLRGPGFRFLRFPGPCKQGPDRMFPDGCTLLLGATMKEMTWFERLITVAGRRKKRKSR